MTVKLKRLIAFVVVMGLAHARGHAQVEQDTPGAAHTHVVGGWSLEELSSLVQTVHRLNRVGITSIVDAGAGFRGYPKAQRTASFNPWIGIGAVLSVMDGRVVYGAQDYGAQDYGALSPVLPEILPAWSPIREFGGDDQAR
nr:hypothetical protein [uncultured Roseateles sp.]